MQFEYFFTEPMAQGILEVTDIGNTAIEAIDDDCNIKYLVTQTRDGQTQVLTFGPYIVDVQALPDNVGHSYMKIEYSTKFLSKIVKGFLTKNITQAREISVEEALENYRDLTESFRKV